MSSRRETYRQGLHSLYLPIYDRLCESLPTCWQPYYGKRSIEVQDSLYAAGRTAPGRIVTRARGGESAHNYGCASDWTLFERSGKALWPKAGSGAWSQYKDACVKAGAFWGGDFEDPDCFHNELALRVSWKRVGEVYFSQGFLAAMSFVGDNERAES